MCLVVGHTQLEKLRGLKSSLIKEISTEKEVHVTHVPLNNKLLPSNQAILVESITEF